MATGFYKVHFHKMKDRKEERWTTSTRLKEGINIIRTFKDNKYDIRVRGPRLATEALTKGIKVDKASLVEVFDSRPKVVLITLDGGITGRVEGVKMEKTGVVLKRTVPKILLRTGTRTVEVNYHDIDEVFIQPKASTWSSLIRHRKDDYYYDAYIISVEGEYTFEVRRG
ncbi:hypothetical protein E3E30_08190 [Thermococcus sp. 9N3]|nr:hypothetical protein [Thermococcus sp. 9N3]